MLRHARSIYAFVSSLDLLLLLAVLLVIAGTWAFVEVLGEMREGDTEAFDTWAIETIGGWAAPKWVEEIGRDLTALGGIAVLSLMTAAVCGYLVFMKKYHALVLLLVATAGALLLSTALKSVIDRPRPALVEHRSYVITRSFPSGHAMLSAAVYLTMGALLARLTNRRVLKLYYLGVAMVLTGLVGISRVFLGVHWPTDVLAGWSAGLVWAILCWGAARWLQSRGKVEAAE
ncbi:MAG: phosphatase PAP2 family protein [Burkholderiales bacterium]|nr:phosphatase PAP2 family protein [Phycisphaerae bacterium]